MGIGSLWFEASVLSLRMGCVAVSKDVFVLLSDEKTMLVRGSQYFKVLGCSSKLRN